jgi:uridine kinase
MCIYFLGRSGSGKTTLSKHIEKVFSGKIICDDTLVMYIEQNSKVTLTNLLSKICHILYINNYLDFWHIVTHITTCAKSLSNFTKARERISIEPNHPLPYRSSNAH